MKSVLVKFCDRTFKNIALIWAFGAFLTACGGEESTAPTLNSIDISGPKITLEAPGATTVVRTKSGLLHIPTKDITFQSEDTVYYQKSDTDLGLAISIFSDDFEDLDSVEYLPKDPSKTVTPNDFITFDDYEHLNIQFDTQDISAKTSLNLEYRSSDATKLSVGLISENQSEDSPLRELPVIKSEGKWVSVKIPLSFYTDTDLSSIYTLYIKGDNTIDLKNIFFDGEKIDLTTDGHIVGYSEEHTYGKEFNNYNASAYDIYDGFIEFTVDGEVVDSVGIQEITYTATDSSGNKSTITRFVVVNDEVNPEIILNGDKSIVIDQDSEYFDLGASATDDVDKVLGPDNLTKIITATKYNDKIVASVDTSETGEYKIRYIYTDAAGNSAEVERKIIVAPQEQDVINILIDGVIDPNWNNNEGKGITAFDQALDWQSCTGPGGCPSINWEFVNDDDLDTDGSARGNVLEISHDTSDNGAGVIISSINSVDIRGGKDYGFLTFDVKVISGDPSITFKADCGYPCGGGDQFYEVTQTGRWETVAVPIANLIPNGPEGSSLDLENVKSGFVIQATSAKDTVFRIDNALYDCRAPTCKGVDVPFVPVNWVHEDPTDPVDTTPNAYEGYTQVWADEFNGNAVNPGNWVLDIGTGDNGWGNGELQYYRLENASVADGLLIIEAQKHQPLINIKGTDAKYTSSKLKSEGLFEFKYGRVDIRAVVAKGQGMWSAGWMLGANHSQIGWPYSGEIDIFDTIGGTRDGVPQEGMIVNNMYWNATGSNPDTDTYGPVNIATNGAGEVRINDYNEGTTFSNTFHTFSLIWDEDKIEFQLDGETTKEIDLLDGSVLAETYRNSFYLILNVAVGGAWPRAPDETTEFPDGMLVDYVRVYQTDDDDIDNDGVANNIDDFPLNYAETIDTDGDGVGDNADTAPTNADVQ
jgi:beta-glucanase (GH16 family)